MKHILLSLLLCTSMVRAQEPTVITYNLDGGNMNATEHDAVFIAPEPLHAHNVSMEPIVYAEGEGVFTMGWNAEGDYDTTRYLHLRVNVNNAILHLDSVTFTGRGLSWYGPIIGGVTLFDADTLSGSTVGWQVLDSVLTCTSSMWYMMPHPYDTLVNWWQINSHDHLDLRIYAWGNIPDTLGNPMDETGWIIDNIQLHGKLFPDLSTALPELDLLTIGNSPVEIRDLSGRVVGTRMSQLPDLPRAVYIVSRGGRSRRVAVQ